MALKRSTDLTRTRGAGVPGGMDRDSSVTVIIPTKNEAANIGWVLDRLPAFVDEVIVVDGQSTDGTRAVAKERRPDVVIVREERLGKGMAVRTGVAAASGDFVVMLDADGSMNPEEIGRFIDALSAGNDLVKGSRFMPGAGSTDISLLRDIGNRVLLKIANVLFGTSRSDLCYGFAAFRREAVLGLDLTAVGFEIEAQLFLRAEGAGLRVAEVPSFEAPRRHGASNLNTFRDGFKVLWTIAAEWWRARGPQGMDRRADQRSGVSTGLQSIAIGGAGDEGAPGGAMPSGTARGWSREPNVGDDALLGWAQSRRSSGRRALPATPTLRPRARARRTDPETVEAGDLLR